MMAPGISVKLEKTTPANTMICRRADQQKMRIPSRYVLVLVILYLS